MGLENTRGREFAKLVAYHVFSDVDGSEDFTVMNAERVSDEIGGDRRAAGPSLDWLLSAGLDRLLNFFEKVVVDKETFFDGTCHGAKRAAYFLLRGLRPLWCRMIDLFDSLLRRRVGKPFASCPQGDTSC